MAYVYPEDRIDDGVVMDPRPFNRTLGRYYGEFNGMLDKDNLRREIIDTTRLTDFTGTQALASSEMTGPCNHIASWRATAVQSIAALASGTRYFSVSGIGGTFNTLDSGVIVEASIGYHWTNTVAGANFDNFNTCQFLLYLDGIEIDATGNVSESYMYWSCYLNGYSAVGAGEHTISCKCRLMYSFYDVLTETTVLLPAKLDFTIDYRELIVREVRR